MENLQDGQPGPDESWRELAEHSIGHDQLSTEVPHPDAFRRFTAERRAQVTVPSEPDMAWARQRLAGRHQAA
jgi:hypothetical protein